MWLLIKLCLASTLTLGVVIILLLVVECFRQYNPRALFSRPDCKHLRVVTMVWVVAAIIGIISCLSLIGCAGSYALDVDLKSQGTFPSTKQPVEDLQSPILYYYRTPTYGLSPGVGNSTS